MNITIEKIVYPGKSLARIGGKVFFTDQGLPEETVEIAILKETKRYTQCQTTKIVVPSPYRALPRCNHYRTCSLYQYIDYPQQVEIKKQQIQEMLSQQIKINSPNPEIRRSPQIWGYRNKIKVNIIWKDKKPHPAYNLPQTPDKFIPAEECFLSSELTNLFLKSFIKAITTPPPENIQQLVIRENTKKELLIAIYYDSLLEIKEATGIFKQLINEYPISGLILIDKKTLNKTTMWGKDFFHETINGIDFSIGIGSFFQINTSMLSILADDLQNSLELSADMILADLYCGVGTFGILLSSKIKQVIGVEVDTENSFFIEKNLALNNIKNFDVRLCDCKRAINPLLKQKIDVAIVDPPRNGMDAGTCTTLAKSGPPTLVYISCNPATLVRDLKILLVSYDIKKIYAYDFFPHTPHIETMVLLKRKK